MKKLLAAMSPAQEDRFEQARRARFKPNHLKKLAVIADRGPLDDGGAVVLASLAKSRVAELVRAARERKPGEGALLPSDYAAAARALQRRGRVQVVGSHKKPRLEGPAVVDSDEPRHVACLFYLHPVVPDSMHRPLTLYTDRDHGLKTRTRQ